MVDRVEIFSNGSLVGAGFAERRSYSDNQQSRWRLAEGGECGSSFDSFADFTAACESSARPACDGLHQANPTGGGGVDEICLHRVGGGSLRSLSETGNSGGWLGCKCRCHPRGLGRLFIGDAATAKFVLPTADPGFTHVVNCCDLPNDFDPEQNALLSYDHRPQAEASSSSSPLKDFYTGGPWDSGPPHPRGGFSHRESTAFLGMRLLDDENFDIGAHFDAAVQFIHRALHSSPDSRVLVHCHEGKNRSACIVAAYLIRHVFLNARDEGIPDFGAITRVRAQRIPAKDNLGNKTRCLSNMRFCHALEAYECRCVEEEQAAMKAARAGTKCDGSTGGLRSISNHGLGADAFMSNYSDHSFVRGKPRLRQDFATGSFDLLNTVYGSDY